MADFCLAVSEAHTHLWSDAAPEVGVRSLRVKQGSDDGLVLCYQQAEGVRVGEDIVCVSIL